MSLLQRCWLVVVGVWPLKFSDHAARTALKLTFSGRLGPFHLPRGCLAHFRLQAHPPITRTGKIRRIS